MKIDPLIISILSLCLASFSVGWNIFRDLVLKARVRTSFMVGASVGPAGRETVILAKATNLGPGVVYIQGLTARFSWWARLRGNAPYALIIPDHSHRFATALPAKLEVGQSATIIIPYNQECVLGYRVTGVGLTDSFGRTHWVPGADLRRAKMTFRKELREAQVPSA